MSYLSTRTTRFAVGSVYILVLMLLLVTGFSQHVDAQLDPTAQQETVDAMVNQMFAVTQTAESANPTQTATPIPDAMPSSQTMILAVQVPYPAGVDPQILESAIQAAAQAAAAEVVKQMAQNAPSSDVGTAEGSLPDTETVVRSQPSEVSVSQVTQWQYMFINRCKSKGARSILKIEPAAPVPEPLQKIVNETDINFETPINIINTAGLYGWEFIPLISGVFSFSLDVGYDQDGYPLDYDDDCNTYLIFKRPISYPGLD